MLQNGVSSVPVGSRPCLLILIAVIAVVAVLGLREL